MQLELLNDQGQASSKFDAPETVFGRAYNEDLIHQIVVAYQANARQGTRAQKDREQVHHSTKKPFKQKGTGRARAGMTSSPLWRTPKLLGSPWIAQPPDDNSAACAPNLATSLQHPWAKTRSKLSSSALTTTRPLGGTVRTR